MPSETLKKQVLHESPQRTSSPGTPNVQDDNIYDKDFRDTTLDDGGVFDLRCTDSSVDDIHLQNDFDVLMDPVRP